MTRAEALRALLAKVEAGEARPYEIEEAALEVWSEDVGLARRWEIVSNTEKSYDGSLDAAKALHEAVLPEWRWTAQDEGFCYVYSEQGEHSGIANNHARSWLVCILKALIATEDNREDTDE